MIQFKKSVKSVPLKKQLFQYRLFNTTLKTCPITRTYFKSKARSLNLVCTDK